jgi:DNA helicase-2/ATP-dependent DNA helicase PcrA
MRQYNPPSRFLTDIKASEVAPTIPGITAKPAHTWGEPEIVYDDDGGLDIGDKVQHQLFGVGTVVAIEGMTVSIAFDGRGVKKLNSAFAPLKKVS